MKRRIVAVGFGLLFMAWLAGVLIGPQPERVVATTPAAAPALALTIAPTRLPTAVPTRPAPTATPPSVGTTVAAGNWEITLDAVETLQRIGRGVAQGVFAIFTVSARNLDTSASSLHEWDFDISTPQGTTFRPSRDAAALLVDSPGPLLINLSTEIQPGLSKRYRVAFDLNPALSGYVLHAAKIPFRFSLH